MVTSNPNKLAKRRFLLPLITIMIGAGFVPFNLLSGDAWAALAGTLTSAFLGLEGWKRNSDAMVKVSTIEAAKKAQ